MYASIKNKHIQCKWHSLISKKYYVYEKCIFDEIMCMISHINKEKRELYKSIKSYKNNKKNILALVLY